MFKSAFTRLVRRIYPALVMIGLYAVSSSTVFGAAVKIYDEAANPRADIQKALAVAAKEHKRVNICMIDCNLDIAEQYGVDLTKGVPASAVLNAKGQTIFGQKNGEFESMRTMQTSAVTEFLNRWK